MKKTGKLLFIFLWGLILSITAADVENENHSGSFNIQDPAVINITNSTFTGSSNGEIRSNTKIVINPNTKFDENSHVIISAEGITAYTVNFVAGSNGTISGQAVQYVAPGQNSTEVTAVANTGYAFTGWSDGYSNATRTISNVTANLTLTANFSGEYTITFNTASNGSIEGDLSQQVLSGGKTELVFAVPDAGYKFTGWSDGDLSPFKILENITASQTLTANFALASSGLTGMLWGQKFTFDGLNRRDSVTQHDGYIWQYQYDSLGNVKQAHQVHPTDPLQDKVFDYSYDDIGNRTSSNEDGVSKTYTTNDIQQYIQVNEDGVIKTLTYDLAGNPDKYGDWNLTWDAEDRVKTMIHSINGKKLEFGYDFRGFRGWKKVFNSGDYTNPVEWIGYVYDGNLVTEEIDLNDPNKAIIRSYTWGLDPAGTRQQVGGIGAMVHMEQDGKDYHVVSDAGGNVTNLVESAADGSLTMVNTYERGPFGQTLAKVENVSMPYGYNTKYTDEETSLVYYGYRFLDPIDGRWLNSDPIGVNGGINIYNSVSNNMVNGYVYAAPFGLDFWGLEYVFAGTVYEAVDSTGEPVRGFLPSYQGKAPTNFLNRMNVNHHHWEFFNKKSVHINIHQVFADIPEDMKGVKREAAIRRAIGVVEQAKIDQHGGSITQNKGIATSIMNKIRASGPARLLKGKEFVPKTNLIVLKKAGQTFEEAVKKFGPIKDFIESAHKYAENLKSDKSPKKIKIKGKFVKVCTVVTIFQLSTIMAEAQQRGDINAAVAMFLGYPAGAKLQFNTDFSLAWDRTMAEWGNRPEVDRIPVTWLHSDGRPAVAGYWRPKTYYLPGSKERYKVQTVYELADGEHYALELVDYNGRTSIKLFKKNATLRKN